MAPAHAGISFKIASLTRRHNLFTHFCIFPGDLGRRDRDLLCEKSSFFRPWLYTNLYLWLCWRCIQHDTGDEIQLSYWTVCLFPVTLLSFNEMQHSKWCVIAEECLFSSSNFIYFPPLCVTRFLPHTSCHCFRLFLRDYLKCCHLYFLQRPCAFKGFQDKNKNKGILHALCGYRPICGCKKSASPMETNCRNGWGKIFTIYFTPNQLNVFSWGQKILIYDVAQTI